ncbi:MAG TPA: nicotinate phosphoribosyltransferase [Candidatus Ozemobacteraceae bacterium]|nr:nicotinate phosphoribosyltransferase [Candidatus Ozemobacteraceae bacterium]
MIERTTLYKPSLALLTDLYQLTMAYGYWKSGTADKEAVFTLFFRENPFHGGFAVACGIQPALEFLSRFRYDGDDIAYLSTLTGNDGAPLFEPPFLEHLRDLRFTCEVDAVREGTVVFAHEPLLRVKGSILQAQLVETALLTIINFQTLIATKAARVCHATRGEPVLEFGLRRAHGIDGGLAASRAAYIGGCHATSNVLAGRLYGIPVRGTHAHSWVMSFDTEIESFDAYAAAMPNNCVFLVDTYDTLDGVRHAIQAGNRLRERGHRMVGIRLDSGDLAYLSREARRLLNEAGYKDAVILASNDLDEQIIASLKEQGAAIAVWGVGTKLVTAYDQPALGGVYKLTALRKPGGAWQHPIKLSEQQIKITTPGQLQIRRFERSGEFSADLVYDELQGCPNEPLMVDPLDPTRRRKLGRDLSSEDLLKPAFRNGSIVLDSEPLERSRERTAGQLAGFHGGIKRFVNPHRYPVGLELGLHELKTDLILKARGFSG